MPLKMITNRVMKDSELQQIIFFRKVKKNSHVIFIFVLMTTISNAQKKKKLALFKKARGPENLGFFYQWAKKAICR
jgi:hypothetical protein